MLSVKQGGIKFHFLSLWYDSTWDWTQVSRAIGEHSNHWANQNLSSPWLLSWPRLKKPVSPSIGWYLLKENKNKLIDAFPNNINTNINAKKALSTRFRIRWLYRLQRKRTAFVKRCSGYESKSKEKAPVLKPCTDITPMSTLAQRGNTHLVPISWYFKKLFVFD